MNKYILTIGKNHKDLKKQVLDDDDILNIININLNNHKLYDYSITPCVGYFTHKDGTRIIENSIQILIVSDKKIKNTILKTIPDLKNGLSQECIMFQVEENQDIDFI